MTNMWMVRAGDNAVLYDEFRKKNIVAIGWGIGDVRNRDKDEIKKLLREKYPEAKEGAIRNFSTTITKFISTLKEGDYVVSVSDKNSRYLSLGIITSDYYYDQNVITDKSLDPYNLYNKIRNVKWLCEIPRDELSKFTDDKSLRSSSTLFKIKGESVEEILSFAVNQTMEINLPRNLIYFGAPGTGKSYNLEQDMELISPELDYERVTFHPDYSYANFVGTYKPRPKKDKDGKKTDDITYEYVPGPFMRSLVKALANPNKPFLLIIEEINRANVAAVFGDIFQLLDRDEDNNYESKYDIEASEDMKDYLEEELGEAYEKIRIPPNMFIWATMNSADQGVFPMDTAFKRRWEFKYFGIDHNQDLIEGIKVDLNGREISWNDLRKAINNELLRYGINEDKLIGPFFAFTEYIKKENSEEITVDRFKEIFKNKIIMYLFEDAARARRNELFDGARLKDENVSYSRICDKFDNDGIEIFNANIRKELSES